jgi:hypothetical protein
MRPPRSCFAPASGQGECSWDAFLARTSDKTFKQKILQQFQVRVAHVKWSAAGGWSSRVPIWTCLSGGSGRVAHLLGRALVGPGACSGAVSNPVWHLLSRGRRRAHRVTNWPARPPPIRQISHSCRCAFVSGRLALPPRCLPLQFWLGISLSGPGRGIFRSLAQLETWNRPRFRVDSVPDSSGTKARGQFHTQHRTLGPSRTATA